MQADFIQGGVRGVLPKAPSGVLRTGCGKCDILCERNATVLASDIGRRCEKDNDHQPTERIYSFEVGLMQIPILLTMSLARETICPKGTRPPLAVGG